MKHYDVVIIGAATTGSYFARRMAERGHTVLMLDAKPIERIGDKYDIFHLAKKDFEIFGLPRPEKEVDWAFEFENNKALSAFDRYPKPSVNAVVGMHMHPYTLRMNRWAAEGGTEILYEASFQQFIFDDSGKICGLCYQKDGIVTQVSTYLVADCSGIPSVARRALPDGYGVENFELTPNDMFYVILRYVRYSEEKDYVHGSRGWTYYKTWEAPQADPTGAILGIGANFSFDYAEKIYAEFEKAIPLPCHTVQHIERGATPYRRPPYSMVADRFIAMGDAACLTKPSCGEGVSSSMVQCDIAVSVIDQLLKEHQPLNRSALWTINKQYIEKQGKAFASQLATVSGAVGTNAKENDFFFKEDIVFSAKSFEAMAEGKEMTFSGNEISSMAAKMLWGVFTGKLRIKTICALLKALKNGNQIAEIYSKYPEREEGFETWVQQADATWRACGSMAEAAQNAKT